MKLFRFGFHLILLILVGVLLAVVSGLRQRWSLFVQPQPMQPQPRKSTLRTTRRSTEYGVNLAQVRAWHATPMTEDQFTQLTNLSLMLRTVFDKQMTAVVGPSLLNTLYNVQNSARAAERSFGVGELGDPEESGEIQYDSYEPLNTATYTHRRYNKGMAIERELIDDDEYGEMKNRASKLGMSFNRFVEKQAASTFNNAFDATNHPGPDAVALCSASHPYSPTDSRVQVNAGTSTLSPDAIIATRIAMQKFVDNRSNVLPINPDTIVVPIDLEPTAQVYVRSPQKPGTLDNDINISNEPGFTYRVIGSRYLTDTNNWFMVDSQWAALYLKWFWRVRPEFTDDPASDFNLKLKFRGYTRFSFGWDTWEWIYGHNVS